ncbi:hypothetical protein J3B02_001036 [Coemansia erecta]|nr:hypothetical protein J3B02_001036 [Coemansia erecta]
MSRLPRGSVAGTTAATVSGGIRPPSSGMTLPRSLANRDFMNELPALPALPALTQRVQSGARRATLTNAMFTPPPPADASATIGRSSAISTRNILNGSVSPSPGAVPTDTAASLVMRSPASSTTSKDSMRMTTLSRSLTRSPTRGDPSTLHRQDGHDELPAPGTLSRGGSSLARPSEGPVPNTQPFGGNAAHLRCGEPVYIPVQCLRGTLRYLGPIDGKQGTWAGVELDEVGKGKNDGTVAGKSYFTCLPNTGLFLVPSKVEPLSTQKRSSADVAGEQIPSISSVLSSAPTEVSPSFAAKQSGSAKRTTRPTTMPMAPQRIQAKTPGRSRIPSDANVQTALPNVAGSVSNNSSSSNGISSPAINRRRTQSRIAPIPSGVAFAPEVPTPSRSRPPQATVSRGARRPRPLSTTGSIASNRTSSPPLSRPSSRSLAPSAADQSQIAAATTAAAAAGTPRQLPHSRTNAINGDAHPPASAPTIRRRLVANGTARLSDISAKAPGAGPRTKSSNSADPVDRLCLRIDMLEAENRVLRLKNEQDKAHLAASQMLARDLVGTNAPVSPQLRSTIDGISRLSLRSPMAASLAASAAADSATNSSLDAMQKQLLDANEQLKRERKLSQSQIEALQNQINELSAGIAQKSIEEDRAADNEQLAKSSKAIMELEAQLARAEQNHAQELAAAQNAQSEIVRALEQRLAETEGLQSQLDSKTTELSSLSARLDKSTADLAKMTTMYEELVAEREQEQEHGEEQRQQREDSLSEEAEIVATMKKQIEKLRRDFVDAEEQRQALSDSLEAANVARSEAETRLSIVVPDLEQLRSKTSDYEEKCASLLRYQGFIGEIVQLAREKGSDDSVGNASAESLDPLELLSLSKRLVLQLVDRISVLGQRSAEISDNIKAKDTRISELESELEEAKRLSGHDWTNEDQDQDAENQSGSANSALSDVQSRIEELERINSELIEERNQFIQDQVVFNDYLEKLESESNRLVEDIEQLTVENQRLTEELRVASLHNSTISLDVAAIDSRLAGELADADCSDQAGPAKPSDDNSNDAADQKSGGPATAEAEAEAVADALQHRHQREIGLMQIRIADLEQRKNTEIKRLQEEIGTLEDLVEDKIFNESELNDKIASLSSEVDRLQREIRHLQSSDVSLSKTDASAANASAADQSSLYPSASDAGISGKPVASLSMANTAVSKRHNEDDEDDDEEELIYCDICDVSTHRIADCPEISAPSNIFKQEASIDSLRPYCDNCELFDHWTDECPHGDEMF